MREFFENVVEDIRRIFIRNPWGRYLSLALLSFGAGYLAYSAISQPPSPPIVVSSPTPTPTTVSAPRYSWGEQILINEDDKRKKLEAEKDKDFIDKWEKSILKQKEGATAFQNGDFTKAEEAFQAARNFNKNDPESVIYLNNARTGYNPFQIAVSVPITNGLNRAESILRGVAYAQNEINEKGEINGNKLKVLVIDDFNDLVAASEIANKLVNDPDILAVIGHNKSKVSEKVAEIYDKGGKQGKPLVMISPTSTSNGLTKTDNSENKYQYVFRTVLSSQVLVEKLAKYIDTKKKKNIAFCYDSQDPSNVSYAKSLSQKLKNYKIKSYGIPKKEKDSVGCDVHEIPESEAQKKIKKIKTVKVDKVEVDGLFVTSDVDHLENALTVAKANDKSFDLFSQENLYDPKVLREGDTAVTGLVLSVPWHRGQSPKFAENSRDFWYGEIDWRNLSAYEATLAIIQAIELLGNNVSRDGIRDELKSNEFKGADERTIDFGESGDRIGEGALVQIQAPSQKNDFMLLQ